MSLHFSVKKCVEFVMAIHFCSKSDAQQLTCVYAQLMNTQQRTSYTHIDKYNTIIFIFLYIHFILL